MTCRAEPEYDADNCPEDTPLEGGRLMAGEAPELRPRHFRRWLSEWPDAKLSAFMLLVAVLISGLLYVLNWSIFG